MLATAIPQPIAYPVSRWNDWPPLAPETVQFVNRLFTPPTRSRESVYDTFIRALVSSGVWAKLDCLYCFAASEEPTALVNIRQDTFRAYREESSGTVTFTANSGYSNGGVNRHISTGFNPSTASGTQFSRNDAMVAIWSGKTTQINSASIQTGVVNTQLEGVSLYPKWSSTNMTAAINSTSGFVASNSNDSSGLFLIQRTASNAAASYQNGTSIVTSSAASASPINGNIYLMCAHLTRFAAIGRSLSAGERTGFQSAVTAYLTSVVGSTP